MILSIGEILADLIGEKNDAFAEFYAFLRGESYFSALGKGENFTDIMRYFYRETVKKTKLKYGMDSRKLYPSDRYALCALLAETGEDLRPAYSFVFVDEAQDISAGEYALLRKINARAAFNVFGDLNQNVTPYRGVESWQRIVPRFRRRINGWDASEKPERASPSPGCAGYSGSHAEQGRNKNAIVRE